MESRLSHGHWNAARRTFNLGPHTNPGLELVLVRNGHITWDYDGTPIHVPAGHLSFTWPWQRHAASGNLLPPVELYWILLPLRGLTKPAAGMRPSGFELNVEIPTADALLGALADLSPPVIRTHSALRNAFIQLVETLMQTDGAIGLRAFGYLCLSLAELHAAITDRTEASAPDRERECVEAFLSQTLPDRIDEVWTLESMAAACNLRRTRFAAIVKHLRGDTPVRVLNRLRIAHAQSLLATTSSPVTDIALACGFSSSQRFATVFRQYQNTTPSSFREFRRLTFTVC